METDYWKRTARTSRYERKTNIAMRNKLKVKTNILTKIDGR